MKEQFTPGPWRRDNEFPLHIFEAQAQSDAICELYDMKRDAETESNARLIAAAPEMYELLNKLRAMPDYSIDDQSIIGEFQKFANRADDILLKINNPRL